MLFTNYPYIKVSNLIELENYYIKRLANKIAELFSYSRLLRHYCNILFKFLN